MTAEQWIAFKEAEKIPLLKFSDDDEQSQGRFIRAERSKHMAKPPLEDLSDINTEKERRAALAAKRGWAGLTPEQYAARAEKNRQNAQGPKARRVV